MRSAIAFAAALLIAGALGASAAAQTAGRDREARALFDAGRVAFVDERYADALEYFQRAHALSGRPELLYNVAVALDRLDRDAEALVQYQAFLAAAPDSRYQEEVRFRVELLESRLTAEPGVDADALDGSHAEATSATGAADAAAVRDARSDVVAAPEPEPTNVVMPSHADASGAAARGGDLEAWIWVVLGLATAGVAAGITTIAVLSHDPGEAAVVPSPGGVVFTLTLSAP